MGTQIMNSLNVKKLKNGFMKSSLEKNYYVKKNVFKNHLKRLTSNDNQEYTNCQKEHAFKQNY